MSSTLRTVEPPVDPPLAERDLLALRAELDRLDDAVHDLLMRRAEVVGRVASLGVKGSVPLRPGREASIIRRLLARHTGRLPMVGIVRIWRELICASTALQRPLLITVCEVGEDRATLAAAREHFGALTPLRVHRSPAQAVREVSSGVATAAVLPLPAAEDAPGAAWWTALLHGRTEAARSRDGVMAEPRKQVMDDPRIHVVARLPFWAARPEGAPKVQALVVSAAPPDPSGQDRSLLGLELPLDVSRARLGTALSAAGFDCGPVILRRDPGASVAHALADVEGFVTDADPRLAALAAVLRPPVVLGAYAVPVAPAQADVT